MAKKKWRFVHTNPESRESYLFEKTRNGTIRTVRFLGYRTSAGKLIRKGRK